MGALSSTFPFPPVPSFAILSCSNLPFPSLPLRLSIGHMDRRQSF